MSEITIEQIEAHHAETTKLIEKFKLQAKATTLRIPAVEIELAPGERYCGATFNPVSETPPGHDAKEAPLQHTEDPDHDEPDLTPAMDQLLLAAETCENNAPIHEAEGNHDQADLSRANAASYRAAIAKLAA